MAICKAVGCHALVSTNEDFCGDCTIEMAVSTKHIEPNEPESMSEKYPQYYKSVGYLTEIDVYAVHYLFDIQDPSGAIQHASKKLLLSGVRTGGKSTYSDIKEARDTLTRWLELNNE